MRWRVGEAGELGRVGQWRAQVAFTRRTRDWGAVGGQGTRGERTLNMKLMVVTPEVFQLEMSALKSVIS